MRRVFVVLFLVATVFVGSAGAQTGTPRIDVPVVGAAANVVPDAGGHHVNVAFVGDSNVVRGAGATVNMLLGGPLSPSHRDSGYVPSFFATPGIPLSPAFWAAKLADPLFRPDVVVLNIGINDTLSRGLYAHYRAKIDAFMRLVPKHVPVLFPGYPYAIEPPARRAGAMVVNHAWAMAQARWHNVIIVPWGALANRHPEWIDRSDPDPNQQVHYTQAGYEALTTLELATLDRLHRPVKRVV